VVGLHDHPSKTDNWIASAAFYGAANEAQAKEQNCRDPLHVLNYAVVTVMRRIYTDPRFPDLQVENDGGHKFTVKEKNEAVGVFSGIELLESQEVSEEFAQRRATDYFNHLAAVDLSGDLAKRDQVKESVPAAQVDRAIAAVKAEFNPQKKAQLEQKARQLFMREERLPVQVVNHLLHDL
jgi:hypothetical protein